jgi:hypothetical protein
MTAAFCRTSTNGIWYSNCRVLLTTILPRTYSIPDARSENRALSRRLVESE